MGGYSAGEIIRALLYWLVVSIPLIVGLVAFLDVARRPSWVWALAGKSRLLWLCLLGMTWLTLCGGLLVAPIYWIWVRPDLVRAERGDIS